MTAKRRPSMLSPFALARHNAIYKGVLGGDRKWMYIGGAVWGVRSLRKALGRSEQIVALEKMEPGQWMSLRTIAPTTRRQRRAAEKSAEQVRKNDKVARKDARLARKSGAT